MPRYEIVCRHYNGTDNLFGQHITSVGVKLNGVGPTIHMSRLDVIADLMPKPPRAQYYVQHEGNIVPVMAKMRDNDHYYIATLPDKVKGDNLENLPDCPADVAFPNDAPV